MEIYNCLVPPFISEKDDTYYDSLKKRFESFIEFISKSAYSKIISGEELRKITDEILKSIEFYLLGNSGDSYKLISDLLKLNIECYKNVSYNLTNKHSLIRLRESSSNLQYRYEMFHIPLDQRQKVTKKRFSIEGLPCLYLSATSYTAWQELNKPSFNSLWASSFRTTVNLPLLDLSFTLTQIINDFEKGKVGEDELLNKLKLFPFVLATSFRVKHSNEYFHEEYIISGNLLQWITKNSEFKGIRYLSTKLSSYLDVDYMWCASNFVIPPFDAETVGLHNRFLKDSFRVTCPHNCATLISYSNAGGVSCYEVGGSGLEEVSEELSNRNEYTPSYIDYYFFSNYNNTSFYNIDGYLKTLFKFDFIDAI